MIESGNAALAGSLDRRLLRSYYAGTFVFLLLDYWAGLNVRVAFLEQAGALRAAYYGFLIFCLALMLWRPAWTAVVGAFESLVTLASLIIATGTRAILIADESLGGAGSYLSLQEIVNFLLSGSVAYVAWAHGLRQLRRGAD